MTIRWLTSPTGVPVGRLVYARLKGYEKCLPVDNLNNTENRYNIVMVITIDCGFPSYRPGTHIKKIKINDTKIERNERNKTKQNRVNSIKVRYWNGV